MENIYPCTLKELIKLVTDFRWFYQNFQGMPVGEISNSWFELTSAVLKKITQFHQPIQIAQTSRDCVLMLLTEMGKQVFLKRYFIKFEELLSLKNRYVKVVIAETQEIPNQLIIPGLQQAIDKSVKINKTPAGRSLESYKKKMGQGFCNVMTILRA